MIDGIVFCIRGSSIACMLMLANPLLINFKMCLKLLIISDTLVKLMEYGEEDDDLEENYEELLSGNSSALDSNSGSVAARKPFWAL